jgi:hypothetical protein
MQLHANAALSLTPRRRTQGPRVSLRTKASTDVRRPRRCRIAARKQASAAPQPTHSEIVQGGSGDKGRPRGRLRIRAALGRGVRMCTFSHTLALRWEIGSCRSL